MELVMFLVMLLFTGFCTVLILVAAFCVARQKNVKDPFDDTTQTSLHDRKTLV